MQFLRGLKSLQLTFLVSGVHLLPTAGTLCALGPSLEQCPDLWLENGGSVPVSAQSGAQHWQALWGRTSTVSFTAYRPDEATLLEDI